jgi:DNA-binding MarR family transcriptional regulator
MLASMDRLGLIRRARNAADRRKVNVFLTGKADALKVRLMPRAHRINDIAGEGVSAQDLATCLAVLKRMSENLTREAARLAAEPQS